MVQLSGAHSEIWLLVFGEILRGACPEPVEGLRMTMQGFQMNTN
jgi:hypothetical protein